MTGSGDIAPGRLAELVDGAPPRDDDERELAALLSATRALEGSAPSGLRARVGARVGAADRARAGPVSLLRERLAGDGRRRRIALVGAPVAAALIAAAIAVPVLTSDDASLPPAMREAQAPGADQAAPEAAPGAGSAVAPPEPRAAQPGFMQLTSTTRVRVDGPEGLARARARATAAVRGLGGVAVASGAGPSGTGGRSRLVFRVPVARAEDAIAAFGSLGTVIGQRPGDAALARRLDAAERRRASVVTLALTLTAG